MRRVLIIGLNLTVGLIGVAALLHMPVIGHTTHVGPDPRFVVKVRTQPIHLFIPMMPGSSSDKPALATLYKDSRACGSLTLPMASFAYAMTWNLDAQPRVAEIKRVGRWDLDRCRLDLG